MSDTKPNTSADSQIEAESTNNEKEGERVPHFLYDRKRRVVSFVAESGHTVDLPTRVIGDDSIEDDVESAEPLTLDEFTDAIVRLSNLGLTWTADSPPMLVPKDEESEVSLGGDEFQQIQRDFPGLPREVGIVISFVLTGNESFAELIGGESLLIPKGDVLKQHLLTPDFRSEFFFKHAIKVPYLEDIDWEVVLKLDEKGVDTRWPAATYGMVSLVLREPSSSPRASHRRSITVAVNDAALARFIDIFEELQARLEASREITDQIPWEYENNEDETEEEVTSND